MTIQDLPPSPKVERFLTSLGEIVGVGTVANHVTLSENIMNAGFHNLVLESLADPFPVNLSELAKSNQAYLYALLNLNPYAITGVNYENVNHEGFLDSSKYSDQFLVDCQAFLFQLTYPATPSTTGDDMQFRDNRLGLEAYAGNGSPDITDRQYLFGNLEGELLTGGSAIDHLYGMDGGDDYLEGGKGQDILNGGSGSDTFFIMGEDTAYDTFNGGEGADTIQGSAGDDTIRVHDFQGANTVEAIDGGGGVDIIAGTDLADTIDLSATTVTGIARIEGGAGADIIKGSSGDDVLYGGSQDNPEDEAHDLLAGGAGADEYHIGIGDIIEDPDNQGTIWFDGEQLQGLVFKQQSEDGAYYETADNTWRGVINDDDSLNIFHGEDAATFTIKNFATGNFGITLADYVPPETTFTFSGESETTTAGMRWSSVGPTPGDTHWYYRFRRELADGAIATEQPEFTLDNIPSVNVTGSEGFDFLYGTTQSDILNGGGGDDIINGWDKRYEEFLPATADMGGDILSGGAGNDYIIGSMGSDAIDGGDDDILSGKDGIDYIFGGEGNDTLFGAADDYYRRIAA